MWRLKIAEGCDDEWLTTTNDHVGRQHWEFDAEGGSAEERAQVEIMRHEFKNNRFRVKQSADLLMRMQLRIENPCIEIPEAVKVKEGEEISEEAIVTTLRRSIGFYSTIQARDGHWPAESAGPLFFVPPLVMALYITRGINVVLSPPHQIEIKRYIYNHQNEDGGWGLHILGHSTIFGSVLSYITLRLLGEDPEGGEDGAVAKGRKWILDHGGATGIPSWGKFWLTVLGVYEWDGCNPMPPEFLLLPNFFPFHPGKMLCYFRLMYIPMSYLYAKRFVGPITGLIRSLREEIYTEAYDGINWNKARNTIAEEDVYYRHPLVQDMLWGFLHHFGEPLLQRRPFSKARAKATALAMKHIHYEDSSTRYICIGGVEKVVCLLACWVEDPESEAYKRHLARIPDYVWVAEDGLKTQSFGCQLWDAALAVQAILSANKISDEYGPTLNRAHAFLKASQVCDDPPGDFRAMYRHTSKGAWTFSMQDHGWQVSDCTSEGLKCALLFSTMPKEMVGEHLQTERMYDAVNVILSLQSDNGGFTAWEPERAPKWLEKFNSTEFFEGVVIEREYVECTSSAIQALVLFKKLHKDHRRDEIDSCITRALNYTCQNQNPDGSWHGGWGICYTYGTWFAVEGLVACGCTYHNSFILRKACKFLLSKQLSDGGWGESYLSSSNKVYTNLEGNRSNLVQTSWALLSLIKAGQGEIDPEPIHRGIRLLINSQMEDGDFPQQGDVTGVFMYHCILNYSSYRNIFPIWALGEYRRNLHGA